jgi:hypothetical protein
MDASLWENICQPIRSAEESCATRYYVIDQQSARARAISSGLERRPWTLIDS